MLRIRTSDSLLLLSLTAALALDACTSKDSNAARGTDAGGICVHRACAAETGGASSGTSCQYNQQTYAPGASFPASDSCNTCYCAATGQIVCSNLICVVPSTGGSPGVGGAVSTGSSRPTGGSLGSGGVNGIGGALGAGGTKSIGGINATGGSTAPAAPRACPGLPYVGMTDAGIGCTGAAVEVEPAPVDIYLMADRTASMTYMIQNTTLERWDALELGIQQFLSDPSVQAAAPRVGLAFFGATGNPNDPTECTATSYATPSIEIDSIATSGPKVSQALSNERTLLGGQTPWFPALEGALQHAQDWQSANPARTTIVVMITDGYPTECDTDINHITQMVGEFYAGTAGTYNTRGQPGIRTYIIGIAVDEFNLDFVSQAGGTGQATIADGSGAANQIASALRDIVQSSSASTQCTISIPPPPGGTALDPNKVQLLYSPFVGSQQELPYLDSASGCAGPNGGYYYDNATAPTRVTLCPCSCANIGAGQLAFLFGCSPAVVIQ